MSRINDWLRAARRRRVSRSSESANGRILAISVVWGCTIEPLPPLRRVLLLDPGRAKIERDAAVPEAGGRLPLRPPGRDRGAQGLRADEGRQGDSQEDGRTAAGRDVEHREPRTTRAGAPRPGLQGHRRAD